ncbi:MAG: hypothetical protein ACPGOV_10430 [Magnetovibrionaceae bacterium]
MADSQAKSEHLPDLEGGWVINSGDQNNRWATEIQAVLWPGDETSDPFVLSHECRKERVPFNEEEPGSDALFMTNSPHEFLTVSHRGEFLQIPHIDTVFSVRAMKDLPTLASPMGRVLLPARFPNSPSEVHLPERGVDFLDPESLLRTAANGVPVRKLFFLFEGETVGQSCRLIAPVHYLNFPGTEACGHYLQPISGTIIGPYQNKILPGYFAAAIDCEGGSSKIEFLFAQYVDTWNAMSLSAGLPATVLEQLATVRQHFPTFVRIYNLMQPATGTVRIFRYRE